jgi:hypothetical protein
MLTSATISYLGVFPLLYRETTIIFWKECLRKARIDYSRNFSV